MRRGVCLSQQSSRSPYHIRRGVCLSWQFARSRGNSRDADDCPSSENRLSAWKLFFAFSKFMIYI